VTGSVTTTAGHRPEATDDVDLVARVAADAFEYP
jgi:hypothetical protein